jgi:Sap, sulfolipid-1-addressing protein
MVWRRRDRPRKERKQPEWLSRRLGGGSPWLAFVIGVVLNLPGVYYLAALKQISVGGYGTATDALLLVAFNVIMFALVEVPLLWYVLSPDDARRRVAALDGWLHAHSSHLAVVIASVVGVYLCAKGVGGALS